ncbi:MAG: DMT family transporter [Alkalispirochaetaceae bacterium]
MSVRHRSRLIVIIAVAFTSVSAILIRLSSAPPLTIAAYRMLFAFLMVAPFAVGRLRGLSRRDLLLATASGALLALHFATWITAVTMTSVASATVLVSLHPILVLAGSVLLLKEKPLPGAAPLIVVALLGTAILSWGDLRSGIGDIRGNLLAIAGAGAVSGYMLLGSNLRRRVGALQYNVLVYGVAAALLFSIALLSGSSLGGFALEEYLLFLGLAFFCTILGHALFNWALKFVRATFVSSSILLEPLFATVMALFVLGEIPSLLTLVGGAVVMGALYGLARGEREAGRKVERKMEVIG